MKKMSIIFYDTETTGLPDWKAPSESETQPHLVQLAAIVTEDDGKVITEIDLIIKPDGWKIPDEVIAIHGITNEKALEVGLSEEDAVKQFFSLWNGQKRVSHNRTFDQRIMRIAAKRYMDDIFPEIWAETEEHDCTMLMAKPIMQMLPKGKYGFKQPKLSEAYLFFTGKELEGAHNALTDARACMEIYFAIKNSAQAQTTTN